MDEAIFTGLLTGVQGAAGKYTQIQDQLTKQKLDEEKAAADMARKENFARFQKSLQGSGMRTASGRELTNEQADVAEAQGEALMDPMTYKQKMQEEASVDEPTQWVDEETGEVLTKGELKARGGKGAEGVISMNAYKEKSKMATEERKSKVASEKEEKKVKAAEEKETKKSNREAVKTFGKTLMSKTEEIAGGGPLSPEQELVAVASTMDTMGGSLNESQMKAIAKNNKKVKMAKAFMNKEQDVLDMLAEGQELNEIAKTFPSKRKFDELIRFMEVRGSIPEKKGLMGMIRGRKGIDD